MTFLYTTIIVLVAFVPLSEMSLFHSFVMTDATIPSVVVPNATSVIVQTTPPKLTIDAFKDSKGQYYTKMKVGAHLVLPAARALDSIFGYIPVFATGYVNRKIPGAYIVYYSARNLMGEIPPITKTLRVIVEE